MNITVTLNNELKSKPTEHQLESGILFSTDHMFEMEYKSDDDQWTQCNLKPY